MSNGQVVGYADTSAGVVHPVLWTEGPPPPTLTPIPPTPTRTPTPSATAPVVLCVGDCHSDHQATVDEILTMVNIALGSADISTCTAGDANGDHQVTVDEILTAVNNALNGCGS